MTGTIHRRDFLKISTAFAAAAAEGFHCVEFASATPIQAPVVDRLSAHVLVDSSFDLFFRPTQATGVSVTPPPRSTPQRNLHSEWGLSLYLQSRQAAEQRMSAVIIS